MQIAEKRLAAAVLSRSIVIEKDHNVTFADVVGLDKAKKALKKAVIFPMKYPTMMEGLSPWRAILLFGVSYFDFIVINTKLNIVSLAATRHW